MPSGKNPEICIFILSSNNSLKAIKPLFPSKACFDIRNQLCEMIATLYMGRKNDI